MPIQVGTSSVTGSTAYPFQRKIIKTSDGLLWLFSNVNTNYVVSKKSVDNGVTWDASWTNFWSTSYNPTSFDVYYESSDDSIYIVADLSVAARLYFRKFTYSAGVWTGGTAVNIVSAGRSRPTITKRSNGDLWVGSVDGSSDIRLYYSINDGANWTALSAVATSSYAVKVISKGSDIWVISQELSKLVYYEYISSLSSSIDIATSITDASSFGIIKIGNDIWIAGITASGIKVYKWNNSSWDLGTLVSGNTADIYPALCAIGNNPALFYKDSTGDIVYQRFNGSSWLSAIDVSSDNTDHRFPSLLESNNASLYVFWRKNTNNNLYFERIDIVVSNLQNINSDAKLKKLAVQQNLNSDTKLIVRSITNINSNATLKQTNIQRSINSAAILKKINIQNNIQSAAYISNSIRKHILSDTKLKKLNIQQTILSDANIINRIQRTIQSDTKLKKLNIQNNIFSNSKLVYLILKDFNNKIRIVKQVLSDVNNKFSFVIRQIKDTSNYVNFVKYITSDISNNIRTKKLIKNNINNDIRFLAGWQQPGVAGFQSLGKTYVKVYINSVEQTDINVDSIRIDKAINSAHTASFDLAKAYDSTKPATESIVEIKYNDYLLYKGNIISISPSDSPESITINCQNEFRKKNKTNKYFFVGHKPTDNKEKYYNTIQEAISSEYSWNLDLGNFIPQTINCFSVPESDALATLLSQAGNYGFYYDENGNKKLWSANEGTIINLERQQIGKNLGLYQILNHRFQETIDGIVNKFRVQMGDKVVKKLNNLGGSRTYTATNYYHFQRDLVSKWDNDLEKLSINSTSGYGWDYQKPAESKTYDDVFRKYEIKWSLSDIGSFDDWKPPVLIVYSRGDGIYGYGNQSKVILTDGFSIDYENGIVTLSDPLFCYYSDSQGNIVGIRSPLFKLEGWKKRTYTWTSSPTENPEVDIANPLMFFTAQMGSYSETIIEDLDLTSLSIQSGGTYYDKQGNLIVIPSWDDTNFAKDYANWQLSKICDKKISGNIEITLDAACFYNIDLSKLIYINGITESNMNINSISYDLANFTVLIQLENPKNYKRTVSLETRGE